MPDRVLLEVLGTKKPTDFLRKLDGILTHQASHGRVLVGRYWNDITDDELTPSHVRGGSGPAIHVALSEEVRRQQARGEDVFLPPEKWPQPSELDDRKEQFLDLMRQYAGWMETERPDSLRELRNGGVEHRAQLIQESGDAMAKLAPVASRRYRRPAWQRVLREFPDRCAAGRWLRLIVWYAMQHASAPDTGDKRLGNDYDDAHYAFLSLYTKHIWTPDPGMAQAVRAVSGGGVRVHESWTTIPCYGGG